MEEKKESWIEKEKEKISLINELNQLSSNFEKNKERMIEIAKILLSEHYWYKKNPPKEKNWL